MKYTPQEYIESGYHDGDQCEAQNIKTKIVKCRKPHFCTGGCDSTIKVGEYALSEEAFLDGKPVSAYTCLPCIDKWLDLLKMNCLDCASYDKCVLGSPGKACADFTVKEATP